MHFSLNGFAQEWYYRLSNQMAKPIPVKDSVELASLLKALVEDIRTCHEYLRLYRKLNEALKEYDTEFHQSPAFWGLTFGALHDAIGLRLCRIYDQDDSANHLHGLLLTIQKHPDLFEEPQFRTRLKDNPSVDYLAKHGTVPKSNDLDADLKLTSLKDAEVLLLYKWRNTIIAHSNAKVAKGTSNWPQTNPLPWKVIDDLVSRAFHIFNRYSLLFNAETYTPMLIGENDYQGLLHLVRLGLKKSREDRGL